MLGVLGIAHTGRSCCEIELKECGELRWAVVGYPLLIIMPDRKHLEEVAGGAYFGL